MYQVMHTKHTGPTLIINRNWIVFAFRTVPSSKWLSHKWFTLLYIHCLKCGVWKRGLRILHHLYITFYVLIRFTYFPLKYRPLLEFSRLYGLSVRRYQNLCKGYKIMYNQRFLDNDYGIHSIEFDMRPDIIRLVSGMANSWASIRYIYIRDRTWNDAYNHCASIVIASLSHIIQSYFHGI